MQTFGGRILHSSVYRNATPFSGQRALVVGFGNSGAEIALDLCESGAAATLAVRSPVRVLPRDWLGLPIVGFSIVQRSLPARIADAINAPFRRRDRFADRPAPSDRHRRGARRRCGGATAGRKTKLTPHSADVVSASACSSPPMRPFSAA
jgi:cation diffusion facilitator CzcD-associated flavoprotein CzcO